jgi:hypothetical protein
VHKSLLKAEVYVCSEIYTELTITQFDGAITVRNDRAVVECNLSSGSLSLYVPSDRNGLQSCYETEMPGKIANEVLGIEDRGASKIVLRLLNDPSRDTDDIMRDEDIPDVAWIEKPPIVVQRPPTERTPSTTTTSQSMIEPATDTMVEQLPLTTATATNMAVTVRETMTSAQAPRRPLVFAQPVPIVTNLEEEAPWRRVARSEQYRKVLEEVTRQARRLPRDSEADLELGAINEAIGDLSLSINYADLTTAFIGQSTFENNARIGAAGELFVFERLRALNIQNFTIDNWQSRIRHHIRDHPDYRDLAPWTGQEVSDLMYTGNSFQLTTFLIKASRPHAHPRFLSQFLARPVKFHLEVKTTLGPCTTPFFMSQNQYRLMREKACDQESWDTPEELYVVLRVYNLLSKQIGVRAYVNPWHLKDGVLEFVADPWKVAPRADEDTDGRLRIL